MTDALLALEDGRMFRGRRFGALSDAAGEVVFNTSMTGYQEILGDPSYAGQIVVMTYPMIGNYGIAAEDFESRKPFVEGLVVREPSRIASNWRHERTLQDYLAAHGVPGFCDFDTRALVRHLRDHGSKRGVIGDARAGADALVERARAVKPMAGCDLASVVTIEKSYPWVKPSYALPENGGAEAGGDELGAPAHARVPKAGAAHAARGRGSMAHGEGSAVAGEPFRVVVLDCGVKWNILRRLVDVGCDVTATPATTGVEEILRLKPHGVVISNGPGDPEPVQYAVDTVRALIGRVPIMGICLGHQLLGLADGGKTYRLKFGHRGGNHPVMDLTTRKVEITSHNHGFAVDPDSLSDKDVELTHINLNDQTLEGLRLRNAPAFSVQYHPEASPGPHDARYLFDRFAGMMREHAGARR